MTTDLVAHIQAPTTLAQIAAALPKHLDPARFARIMITEVRKNPDLAKCDPGSFLSAMVQSAQLGLEPGSGLGLSYFIPFRNSKKGIMECQFIVGYKGLLALARRSGLIKRLSAACVYDGDEFDYELGLGERLVHKPMGNTNPSAITHVYAIAEFTDGGHQMEVMTRQQVDAIKMRGRANSVWNSDYAEMAKKTALRRISKYLPLSPELSDAIRADGEDDMAQPMRHDPVKIAAFQADASAGDPIFEARDAFQDAIGLCQNADIDPAKVVEYPDLNSLTALSMATEKLLAAAKAKPTPVPSATDHDLHS